MVTQVPTPPPQIFLNTEVCPHSSTRRQSGEIFSEKAKALQNIERSIVESPEENETIC